VLAKRADEQDQGPSDWEMWMSQCGMDCPILRENVLGFKKLNIHKMWRDGLERVSNVYYRQVPQRYTWSSALFVSRGGHALRRFYNSIEHSFTWKDRPLAQDDTGRVGLHMQQGHFLPIETIVALAWRRREADSTTKVIVSGDGAVRWVAEEGENGLEHLGETWKPLRYRLGLIPCNTDYRISSHCRLQSPFQDKNNQRPITSGFWWDDQRWAAVKDAGLVSLTQAASRTRERGAMPPPYLSTAIDCLMSGHTAEELAHAQSIAVTTAWSYYSKLVPYVHDKAELRRVGKELVPEELWTMLSRMKREGDPLLGECLSDLIHKADAELDDFASEHLRFEYLRFARMILLA